MTNKPAPKLIRIEPNKIWYLTTYYFECVDCGSEFFRHRYDSRTNPYCGMCQRKHDTEAQRERNKLKSAETEYWKRVAKSYERKINELEGTKEDVRKDHYKEYQHKYYMTVTKRKRLQKRLQKENK